MKEFLFASAFLVCALTSTAQNNTEMADLVAVSDHYRELNNLDLQISYRVYADTLGKTLMDSSTERFISSNGDSYTSQLNTVSIIRDSIVFFIDHDRKMAYLDRKPILNNQSLSDRIQEFLNQRGGFVRYDLGQGKYRYRIFSDRINYDWIEIDVNLNAKKLNKVVYRFSDQNSSAKGAKLLVMEITKQDIGKPVSNSRFSLDNYLILPDDKSGNLPVLNARYHNYKFYSYLY